LNDAAQNDRDRWNKMMRSWYGSGAAYRTMDRIDGTPNPVWDRWLAHPDYDAYWQQMIPHGNEFAAIDIPVLTTTGYYDGAQVGALYYFNQHFHFRPNAEHHLLIGPYDHISSQHGVVDGLGDIDDTLEGYRLDLVAKIDISELRYQWFDHVFKGGPMPAVLADKVNFEEMGANEWKHAPSLATMADGSLRLQLNPRRENGHRLLQAVVAEAGNAVPKQPDADDFTLLRVDLADRSDVDAVSPSNGGIVDRHLDGRNGVVFVSAPMDKATEFSGIFAGQLDFIANHSDFDLKVETYELTPGGDYISLSWWLTRMSYAHDRSHRRLLTPNKRQVFPFTSGRSTSRLLQRGSKLVVVLSVVKQSDIEINYGSGKPVADETISDAKSPVEIRWFSDSYIDVPVTGH
jgi:putative CocE/NonD family hydrolase